MFITPQNCVTLRLAQGLKAPDLRSESGLGAISITRTRVDVLHVHVSIHPSLHMHGLMYIYILYT